MYKVIVFTFDGTDKYGRANRKVIARGLTLEDAQEQVTLNTPCIKYDEEIEE
tara:strand:- start:371 stop:526 length:156 start_codon:yes stop_codon:yes gene_type:complete